ncbi:MAG: hypothetical protein P8183_20410 [Anaerolineae bacterium]
MLHQKLAEQLTDIKEPVRPNYYHGMMVTDYTFNQLTNYFNSKRWLLNRHIIGYGVVCGLDVIQSQGTAVCVTPGLAIDKAGRELIVPKTTQPLTIPQDLPPLPDEECEEDEYYLHLVICYEECLADPAPVLAGDCQVDPDCLPGAVRERYRLEFRPGKAEKLSLEVGEIMPDVIRNNRINYDELELWVTQGCPQMPENTCIPLANICLTHNDNENRYETEDTGIDVTIRPIVYTNDVLFLLLLSQMADNPRHRRK